MREIGHVHLLYDSVGPYLTVKSIADAIEPIPRLCEQRSDFGNSATHSQLASIEEATQTAVANPTDRLIDWRGALASWSLTPAADQLCPVRK
jgi:hypothetical protein